MNKTSEEKRKSLRVEAVEKVGQARKKLGRKFKILHGYMRKILKERNVIIHKRKFAPKYTQKQLIAHKTQLQKLRESVPNPTNNLDVPLDDELNVSFIDQLVTSQIAKLFVWLAGSRRGQS